MIYYFFLYIFNLTDSNKCQSNTDEKPWKLCLIKIFWKWRFKQRYDLIRQNNQEKKGSTPEEIQLVCKICLCRVTASHMKMHSKLCKESAELTQSLASMKQEIGSFFDFLENLKRHYQTQNSILR